MAVNKRDLGGIDGETGWPFVNYAQEERNMQAAPGNIASALSIPRFKFTWLVEFTLSPRALDNPVTNLGEFITDGGRLYTHLLTIDHPSPTIKTEKLRSYNKWINVPTQVEYPQASMTFHDDSTSIVQALWKEHLNFYTHQATIGDTISGLEVNTNLGGSTRESNSYQFTDDLTATDGGEMRSSMGRRPSLGMRMKPNDGRHFFETIKIADLGTEPDGINMYFYHRPMITGWAHDNLDKEDRTGNVRVSATFDYEGYYFTLGQNRGRVSGTSVAGRAPSDSPRKAGIARDGLEITNNRPVDQVNVIPTTMATSASQAQAAEEFEHANEFADITEPALDKGELNPVIPNSLAGKQRDLDQVQAEKDAINADPARAANNTERLAALDEREAELNKAVQQQKAEEFANESVSAQESSALQNTKDAAGVGAPPVDTNKIPNPANQEKSDNFATAALRSARLSVNLGNISSSQGSQAQIQANLGNVSLSNDLQDQSDANKAASVEAQENADALEAESERIDPNTEK